MTQKKQREWTDQWGKFKDDSLFLFTEWIYPWTLDAFKNKRVLDAGCGPGNHLTYVAPYAKEVVGVDLNTAEIAREETKNLKNVYVVDGDIADVHLASFDMSYCIGVIHHTDNPDQTFDHLRRLTKIGGTLIVWCYSEEGNELTQKLVKIRFPKWSLDIVTLLGTLFLYPLVYSIYRLPVFSKVLPYYEYFKNFRVLSFKRNRENIYDKLNAPQTHFIKKEQIYQWFNNYHFERIHISQYRGVSWRCSGVRKN